MLTGPKTNLSIEQFAARLAPVLGNEQALLTVRAGVRAIAREGELLTPEDQRNVLSWLGAQSGVVAAAARHLLRKFDGTSESGTARIADSTPQPAAAFAVGGARRSTAPPQRAPTAPLDTGMRTTLRTSMRSSLEDDGRDDLVHRHELVEMFARATGSERAQELIDRACAAAGAEGVAMRRTVAVDVLERLTAETGVVGVVARFAKARIALKPR